MLLSRPLPRERWGLTASAAASDHVGDPVPKLADFGISKLLELHSGARLTGDRGLVGTLAYASPEQIQAAHLAAAPADQYSIGVVLYECLTGHLPFEAEGVI